MSEQATVTTEVRGKVLVIGLNRAEKLNSFNLQMLRELSATYSRFEKDPELWCALLHAHGKNFTSGLDLSEVGPAVATGEGLFPKDGIDPLDLHPPRRSKPVVCAVQGWCLTIGMELLMASDIRLAAEGTTFAQMEVQRGIMAFGGATLRLPQIAGWGNAMLHLLTGDRFDAAEAFRIGLVQRVVAPEELFDAALEVATRVASRAPLAVQASLASARRAVEEGPESARQELMSQARALMDSEDAGEGMQSFVERRDAVFRGR
jgi:enoyl-CoA hydratase/carnithine racemase